MTEVQQRALREHRNPVDPAFYFAGAVPTQRMVPALWTHRRHWFSADTETEGCARCLLSGTDPIHISVGEPGYEQVNLDD